MSGTIGINLFNSQNVTSGWLNQSGDVEPTNNYYVSDYIEVIPSTQYYISATGSARLKFYDSNKKALTNTWDGTGGSAGVFTTNASTAYVRFTISINNDINAVILNLSNPSINGTYYPFRGLRKGISENLTHQAELLVDGYMTPIFGSVHNSSDGQRYDKRIGRVDLGSLEWTWYASWNAWVTTSEQTHKKPFDGSEKFNGYSSRYECVSAGEGSATQYNQIWASTSSNNIWVATGSNVDKPVGYLYFELATPETYDLVNISNNNRNYAYSCETMIDGSYDLTKLQSGLYYINLSSGTGGKQLPDKTKLEDGILIITSTLTHWVNYFVFGYRGHIAFGQRRRTEETIAWKYGETTLT